MATIPSTRGNPQANDVAVQTALPMVGSASREDLQATLGFVDAELAKLFEDRNIQLIDGGLISFLGTSVQFTQPLKLHINSKVAGGAPVIIDLAATTRTTSADGRMIYAVINRTAGTATVTDDAATLPAVTSSNQEVILIAKRSDSGDGIKRLYFRNGTALDEGQTARLGSSGSGAGNANEYIETLKNHLLDSFYELVTPNIFSVDEDNLVDGSSTGAYSLVDKSFNMTAGQTMVSTNMLDSSEFSTSFDSLSEAELLVFWRLSDINTAATYHLSRNGGNEWQQVTMERVGLTDLYRGLLTFATEATPQSLSSNATGAANRELDASTRQKLSQKVTLASKVMVRSVDLTVTKTGSPAGYLFVSIVKDDGASKPSLLSTDVLCESAPITMSSISTGTLAVSLPETTLIPGDYHIVLRTVGYTSTFVTNTTSLKWDADSAGASPFMTSYNSTVWAIETNYKAKYNLKGITLDLRVRVTSNTNPGKLEATGIYYDKTLSSKVADGQINLQVFEFSGSLDTTTFTLTNFMPHPDLLKVYDVNSGQVYTYGSFGLDGHNVIFEAGQFLNPGETIKLRFMQVEGTVFDNSDVNGLLLASNFLGSTDPSIDRSQPGRGIFLRRPDGTLRELTITDADGIAIYSV
jgi:hypothetical protein